MSSATTAASRQTTRRLATLLFLGGTTTAALALAATTAGRDSDDNMVLFAEENTAAAVEATDKSTESLGNLVDDDETPDHRYVLSDPEGNSVLSFLRGKSKDEFEITLYQYQVCPFCCKARAFLDYHRIPYRVVEVNPITKSEVKFSKDYRKVPITVVGKEQVNDSSFIITTLSHIVRADRPQTEEEKKWRKWVDGSLVRVLPPNIYRTMREATEAFEYISEMNDFSFVQKYAAKYLGSTAMYGVSKRLKKRYNIVDEREVLYTLARQWTTEALRGGKTFHGGSQPDLADLAVYGVLSSIEGLEAFKDMLQNTDIGPWYERVKAEVGASSRIN